jgi:tetratricopeptide (TPR) repeat protein
MTRAEYGALAVILLLALALRLAYLSQVRSHPLFTVLTGDPAVYFAQARDVLSGRLVPDHAYFHSSPLYPFFLALVARLGGENLHAIRVVQSCIGTLSVCLVFVLTRLTLGRGSALIAGALAALYVPFIFFEAEVLEITIVIAAVLGSLTMLVLAIDRSRVWMAIAAGSLVGIAGLGKPNILLFAPAGAVWLFARWRERVERSPAAGKSGGGPGGLAGRLLPAAVFFAAAGCVVLPATIHNYRVSGDLIPVSSNGGINFYIGNHTNSPGVFQVPPDMRFDLRVASTAAAERATGRALSAGEVSDFWFGQALDQIGRDPGRWAALMARKFVLFWNHYEIPNHYHLYFVRRFAPILRIPIGTFGVVAPLGLFGVVLALLRKERIGLLALFGLVFMASVVPFFITGRYRLAIVPVLLAGAGYGANWMWRTLRQADWRRLAVGGACIAALAAGINVNTIEFGFAQMHNSVGSILGSRGDMEAAVRQFEMAVEEDPDDLSSRYNLGLALLELSRFDEASAQFERAIARHRGYYEAWLGLARAQAGAGLVDEAAATLDALLEMGPPQQIVAQAERMASSLTAGPAGEDRRPRTLRSNQSEAEGDAAR